MRKFPGEQSIMKKTKRLFIGRLWGKPPRFTKLSWVRDNINTIGVYHVYNIDPDTVWKTLINKMKSCTQIWKTNKITVKGKTLIVKNILVSELGYEIEMRGIPDWSKNEIKVNIWKCIWDDRVNKIDRNVCCLDTKEGKMGMINIENLIRSNQVNIINRIIHSDFEWWNYIGIYWLRKYDNGFGSDYFRCQCSDISGLNITSLPSYYQKAIKYWYFF